jgi:hypothetical protein
MEKEVNALKDEKSYRNAFYIVLILQILVLSYDAIFHLGKNKEYKVYITEIYSLKKEEMENDEDFILTIKNEFKTGNDVVVNVPFEYDKEKMLKIATEYGYKIIFLDKIRNTDNTYDIVRIILRKNSNSKRPIISEDRLGEEASISEIENADMIVIPEINENFKEDKFFKVVLTNAKANNFVSVVLPKEYDYFELVKFMLKNNFYLKSNENDMNVQINGVLREKAYYKLIFEKMKG